MDVFELMKARHSVRTYLETPIREEHLEILREEIELCRRDSGLNIKLMTEEPEAFTGMLAHYGKFSGVRNYLAFVARKEEGLEEKIGWYGERLVLKAQMLGINSCWVALTFNKKRCRALLNMEEGEWLYMVISLGYGANQGKEHKNKPMESFYRLNGEAPAWFMRGIEAAMLAPTAINQQNFRFTLLEKNKVLAENLGGPCSKYDLGIAKYHFVLGAGEENFDWA